jgi:hypothetical protein
MRSSSDARGRCCQPIKSAKPNPNRSSVPAKGIFHVQEQGQMSSNTVHPGGKDLRGQGCSPRDDNLMGLNTLTCETALL